MRDIKLLFTLAGLSGAILIFSAYGFFATFNPLYIIAFTLSSAAVTFALYCLYQYKQPVDSEIKKDFYFYFIDNTPASHDLLNRHLGDRR